MSLTPARVAVIRAMDRHWRQHPQWQWPTLRELAAATGKSTVTIFETLQYLSRSGHVLHYQDQARAYRLAPPDLLQRRGTAMPPSPSIPVVGVLRAEDGLVMKPVRPCAPSPDEFAQAVVDAVAQARQDLESGEMYQP